MQPKPIQFLSAVFFILASCSTARKAAKRAEPSVSVKATETATTPVPAKKTFTKPLKIDREEFVSFAKTLLGTPYKYGSAIPRDGLDCSGFITYVFGHFNINCPRTSIAFTNEGRDIDPGDAQPGDIILFTGSDNSTGIVGHMGIITATEPALQFIHSASGKNIGVILNSLAGYYKTHFVKVIRILE